MDIAIIIIITAVVAIYIVLPFFLRQDKVLTNDHIEFNSSESKSNLEETLKTLDNQKETLYSAIKDIEFDYGLGKLSKEDFEELNAKYKLEAANVLKQIDEIEKQSYLLAPDNKLEQEILSYRSTTKKSDIRDDKELEEEVATFRSANKSNLYCSDCKAEYSAGDMFCSKCGAKLN